jgi:predicted Zn-dependent peptidase
LRNELGWIYSLQSTFDKSTSTLNLELSCEIKYISKIVDEVKKVFSDFEKVYSPKKAEILRQMTVKRQEMAQDEPQIITDFLVDNLSEFGVPLTYAEYVKKLALVTTEDIKALFDEIKTGLDKMRIVVTSNKKEVEKLVF